MGNKVARIISLAICLNYRKGYNYIWKNIGHWEKKNSKRYYTILPVDLFKCNCEIQKMSHIKYNLVSPMLKIFLNVMLKDLIVLEHSRVGGGCLILYVYIFQTVYCYTYVTFTEGSNLICHL